MIDLRPYQTTLTADVQSMWSQGARFVLMRLDTGGGKTVILAFLILNHQGAVAVIAHRQELVGQLSMTLAKLGVHHDIIAAQKTRRAIASEHLQELGQSFYVPGHRVKVASVDTLVLADGLEGWAAQVTLWVVDEAHHVVVDNKWHTAISKFTHPACVGLGPTATPKRADGKGLGAHNDGVFHAMVQGPPMRWLIDQGYLTDYRIICPESDLQVFEEVGASGDWSPKQGREASKRSHIVGDVVNEYCRWAPGRLGITFATDVETAMEMTAAYRLRGIRAETLHGKVESGFRRQILKQFERREILQIVAVDIVSEGFDLPAIEVASLARPTQSLAVYMQQFGRTLRPMPGKTEALIIDHAGNTLRHQGPPDKPRHWDLERRGKRGGGGGGIPMRSCSGTKEAPGCMRPYERTFHACPYCGMEPPPPADRSSPAAVDGDLVELDAMTLARLRGEVDEAQMSLDDYRHKLAATGLPNGYILANAKTHAARLEAHGGLRHAMEAFGGRRRAEGKTDRQMQREFFFAFGIDVLSAQALSRADAEQLAEKVNAYG